MISEALEQYEVGGRVSHSRCIGVVGHGCGWLREGRDGGVDGKHVGQSLGVSSMSMDAGALPECEVKTLFTSAHTAFHVCSSG